MSLSREYTFQPIIISFLIMALKRRRSDVEAALAHVTPEQIRSQFALVEEEDVENNKRRCRLCGDVYKAKNDTGHGSKTSLRFHAMDSHLQQILGHVLETFSAVSVAVGDYRQSLAPKTVENQTLLNLNGPKLGVCGWLK